ncbi:MAG TPA: folylpolyglutamate synthase/dihydrofolate synthase family protein [Polyangia bacterium]|nr:folylpolyglutamate synthase/dihydrofolate synthase family protein [Polyangia bacterium]
MATPRYADLLARLERVRALGVELGLERVRRALAAMGDPQRRFAAVQIAGTNGKGSTAAMTEAILRAAGIRTGLYTSPHLARFTERIRVNGVEAEGDHLAALDARVAACGVPLTYFEVATALAFLTFAEAGVEVAVLETGLGGRLDAVTTCEPAATAITSIALDHTDYLGDTLREIAREKAGITKPGVPCLLPARSTFPPEVEDELARVAAEVGAPLLRLGRDFSPVEAAPALSGPHQRANAAIAVELSRRAVAAAGRALPAEAIARGLAHVRWPGRLERVADDVLLDCAHNVEGAQALAAALPGLAGGRPVALVTSVVRDKDAAAILDGLAPHVAAIVATASRNPRSLPADQLATLAAPRCARVHTVRDPRDALALARDIASPDGLVLVAGSIFLVGELRAHLLNEPVDPAPTSDPV